MPGHLFSEPKHRDWLENATFNNCLLNRKSFGEFLSNYLVGEKDGFVLNLNGSWGTGKTEFCKRLYSDLITKDHPCIYIDAWESDFSKEPLTVVASELLKQMELLHSDIVGLDKTQEIKRVLGRTLKGLFVGLAGGLTKKLFDDSAGGIAVAQQLVGADVEPDKFIEQLADDYTEQVESIKLIRETLTDLASTLEIEIGTKLPVVVIIDELDRCRPNYAIEMLEVIKHFFTTKNFVFVVASDTEQLCESIRNVYGSKFDSNQYLKRFFDRTATLPLPNVEEYVSATDIDLTGISSLTLYPKLSNNLALTVVKTISAISHAFDLKIRDIDQLINRVVSCLRTAKTYQDIQGTPQAISLPVLVCGLIEYEKNLLSYRDRTVRKESRPTMGKDNRYYDPEINASTLVNLCLFGITEQEQQEEQFGTRHRQIYYTLPFGGELVADDWSHDEGVSISVRNICQQIGNINRNAVSRPESEKVWRWSDYKQVIELAGYLN